MKSTEKRGLLILGASGGLSGAFLQLLTAHRSKFADLVLLDRSDSFVGSKYHDHETLQYVFFQHDLTQDNTREVIRKIVKQHAVSLILDNTDADTDPVLAIADELEVSYFNCALNPLPPVEIFIQEIDLLKEKYTNSQHVIGLGMNPGIINHFILKLVEEYGIPNEFVEIEYDSGKAVEDRGKPFITWSRAQFLAETVMANTGYSGNGGVFQELQTNALSTTVNTREYLEPIKKMERYPVGMIVPHDEIIMLAHQLGVPGKFVYALHREAFNYLVDTIHIAENQRDIAEESLILEDNIHSPLSGSDCIGAWLLYDDKKVCYYMDVSHKDFVGTNATLFLVAVGALAGLLDFLENPLPRKQVYFVSDLNTDNILKIVSRYAEIKKCVVDR